MVSDVNLLSDSALGRCRFVPHSRLEDVDVELLLGKPRGRFNG